jgi:lipopolysaccharide/colanic/teichoic acid biosynthesis glycosyltransferase
VSVLNIRGDRPVAVFDMRVAASRCLDIVVTAMAVLLFSPLILVIGFAIWLEDGRPILFGQHRLGLGGRPFRMYKFRKFSATCGTDGCPLTMSEDVRLTAVGRVLAATKLDELPQLWNVLKGDMAIVGPRPESLTFADSFQNGYERVLDHKPGLFGPSQVLFRNECQFYPPEADLDRFYREVLFPAKARFDLAYFPHRSILSDIGWIIRGVFAVFGWRPTVKYWHFTAPPTACVATIMKGSQASQKGET